MLPMLVVARSNACAGVLAVVHLCARLAAHCASPHCLQQHTALCSRQTFLLCCKCVMLCACAGALADGGFDVPPAQ